MFFVLRVASSVQQSSAPRQHVRVLFFVNCIVSHPRIPFFYSLYVYMFHAIVVMVLGGVFVVLSYPVPWYLICLP